MRRLLKKVCPRGALQKKGRDHKKKGEFGMYPPIICDIFSCHSSFWGNLKASTIALLSNKSKAWTWTWKWPSPSCLGPMLTCEKRCRHSLLYIVSFCQFFCQKKMYHLGVFVFLLVFFRTIYESYISVPSCSSGSGLRHGSNGAGGCLFRELSPLNF